VSRIFGEGEPMIREEEFRLLRDLVSARIGINLAPSSRHSVGRKLRERLSVLNLNSFNEYFQYLRFHPMASQEWDEAVELLTTNETYFFREDFQLRAYTSELLPMLHERLRQKRRLTVWSAGCSTGEEVYTIAILTHQVGLFSGWDVRIFGSDISRRCVTTARRGVYGPASFRATSPEMRREYFVDRPDGMHVVDWIKPMCHFGQMNLLDDEKARILGRVDVVFCRNVLIYFDPHARRRVIDIFHDRLYPGGVLLLGHSESLLNVSTAFELLHLKEDLVYKKPMPALGSPGSPGSPVGNRS
jgi:chemotaxis protein methyltransferase CheR